MSFANGLGCCFQHFFNDTILVDGLFISGVADLQLIEDIDLFRDPAFWRRCNVDLLPACADPFPQGGSGVKFMASLIVIATAIFAAILFQ